MVCKGKCQRLKNKGLIFEPKMSTFSEKGVNFCAQTVSVYVIAQKSEGRGHSANWSTLISDMSYLYQLSAGTRMSHDAFRYQSDLLLFVKV